MWGTLLALTVLSVRGRFWVRVRGLTVLSVGARARRVDEAGLRLGVRVRDEYLRLVGARARA
eukprot:scaffold63609_cov30-Phaeocystis_antarctica.AAC.1